MSYDNTVRGTTASAKTTIQNQIPFTTRLRHHLALYHPILWWRVTFLKKRIVHWHTYDVLLPFCMNFGTITQLLLPQQQKPKSNEVTLRLETALICFPLYVYLWYKSSRTVWGIIKSIMEVQQSRMIAHPDAYQCLYERIQNYPSRSYRTFAYDVYLPPWNVEGSESYEPKFILFLPGAFVEHVAYSQPAALLSDHGYIVIVMSSEPLGIVDMHLPQFSVSNVQRIQQEMETKHAKRKNNQCRWILMGHSMGSLTCTKLIPYFRNIKQIVLWGSAPFLDYMGNLSHMTSEDGLHVLIVQGTKDEVIQCYCTPEMTQEYWNRLPSSITTLHEIVGGTHQGFGNYIRNIKVDSDSEPVPIQEQHTIAVQVTVDFLQRTNG